MNKRFYLLMLAVAFYTSSHSQEKLQIQPVHPQRGEQVTIRYNTASKGAVISDTASQVNMVFTYSNLYELPWTIPMKKNGDYWETSILLPRYATYATFYVQSGNKKDQPEAGRHFELAVYDKDKRVKDGYLYEGYSMPAQKGKVPGLAAMQASLYEKELLHYPDNYEAKLRLLKYKMDSSASEVVKTRFRKEAEGIIAAKFREHPGNMGEMNRVTMGYLIIGENSRLDSIREVVKSKYPYTEAGYELLIGDIMSGNETAKKIAKLEGLVKNENASNSKYLADAHEALMKLYASKKQEGRALYHLKRSGQDSSPYRPQTLKTRAEILMQAGIGLDTAYSMAEQSLKLADQFPAGLIRYFPETGYLPAYVNPEKRAATTQKAKSNVLSLLALIEMKSGHAASASELMKAALATNQDVETLANAGLFYDRMGEYEKAFASYKSIMLQVPEDTASLAKMKASYSLWKKGSGGWEVEWNDLNEKWKKDMTVQLQKEIMMVKPHDYIKGIVDLQGRPMTIESVKNKIVIIDFWATWCVPCMHEMPYVQKAYEKFANREDVAFMIVNSGAKNSLEDAKGWWGNKKYSFPVYYNTDEQIGEKFGFDFIPSVYIIDKSGNIRFKTIGFEGPSIQRKIEAAIELLSAN